MNLKERIAAAEAKRREASGNAPQNAQNAPGCEADLLKDIYTQLEKIGAQIERYVEKRSDK